MFYEIPVDGNEAELYANLSCRFLLLYIFVDKGIKNVITLQIYN